ncbi:TPA: Glutathione S-transferase theta-1 [Trebouxia sp. C0005]
MTAIAKGRLISFCSYVASQGRHRLQKPCSSQPSIRWLVNEAVEGSAQFIGSTHNKWGSDLRRNLLKAAAEDNLPVVENLLRQYEHTGRHPEVSSLNAVITMYARLRQVDKALATFSKLTSTPKLSPNAKSYRAMLLAYARPSHAAIKLEPAVAAEAEAVFKSMVDAGHVATRIAYHWLMMAQGKAGLVDRAFHTYQEMLAKGYEASTHSIHILLDACARGNQPARGQEIFDTEIPLHNIEISCTSWNSLLSVYDAAGDMDRAYAVWQRMVKAGVVPDEVTQRILVHCFSNNLQMASALVKEARQMRMAAEADPTKPKVMLNKAIVRGQQTSQVHIMEGSIDHKGPYVLDLHGLSKAAAQLALRHRLEYIMDRPDLLQAGRQFRPTFLIVTGRGTHSHVSVAADSMQTVVTNLLRNIQLPYFISKQLPGNVHVTHDALGKVVWCNVCDTKIAFSLLLTVLI